MDEIVLLFGVCGLFLLLAPIVCVILLWSRVGRLQAEIDAMKLRLRSTAAPLRGGRPAETTAGTPGIAEDEIEIVQGPQVRPASIPPRRTAVAPSAGAVAPASAATGQPARPIPRAPEPAAGPGFSFEELLAGKWLTWVGAVAVIIGAGLFFRYSIENNWIGEGGRVVIGLLVGMSAFAGASYAMLRDYRWPGQALAGAAAGILYFALYAAFGFYHLVPVELAFGGMALVTVMVLAFATIFHAQATAILGLIGGFLTPLMLGSGVDRQWELFSYIFLLDLGVLGIATFRKWQALQITAFAFTLLMWLGWFGQFWEPEKLTSTVILLTAFFLLFALLGVWHNILRRVPAQPGDFFLMLATPVAYFVALYAVTLDRFSAWHGVMAVVLAGSYLGLATLQLRRNPAGRMAAVSLAGVAASFLTVAVPLQLTGHWIAIAWAMESLLLVELGLRFGERRLRWAGFGLLAVVLMILFFYAAQTFDNPARFQTRFTPYDPAAAVALGDVPQAQVSPEYAQFDAVAMPTSHLGTGAADAEVPAWRLVLNGRSFSFLITACVLGVLAWEYRRRAATLQTVDGGTATGGSEKSEMWGGLLLVLAPATCLAMLYVESFAVASLHDWLTPSLLSMWTVWTAMAALAMAALSSRTGPRWLDYAALGGFGLAGLLVAASLVRTLSDWRYEWSGLVEAGGNAGLWPYLVVNPRGLGFVVVIAAAALAAVVMSRREEFEDPATDGPREEAGSLPVARLLGVFAYLTGLIMLTTEVYAQGVILGWGSKTPLSITVVWLLYAIGTLVVGIYYRSSTVRVLALSLFLLTTGKVFLYDVWHVSREWKTVAFTALGVALLLVSFVYRRYRERIRAWITTTAVLIAVGASGLGTDRLVVAADEPARPPLETLPYRWVIEPPLPAADERGLVGLVLPPDLYEAARSDLGDLRVLRASDSALAASDIPYVLFQPQDRLDVHELSIPLLNLSRVDGDTQFLLELGETAEPIRQIVIEVARGETNFERSVRVYGADARDAESWALLADEGYVLDRTRDQHKLRVERIELPRSRYAFYKVVVANGGKPPLEIKGARIGERNDVRAPRREFEGEIVSQALDSRAKQSVIVIDLKHVQLPTTGLRLRIEAADDYDRSVRLETADGFDEETRWRHVASFGIYRIERGGIRAARRNDVEYPESRGRYLRITIDNGDDRPLHVSGATALAIDRWLFLERRRLDETANPAALYAGDPRMPAPRYDLARTIGPIAADRLPPAVAIAARTANPHFSGPAAVQLPWSERNRPLLWALTIGGVLVFGALTGLFLWQAAGKPQPPGE